MSKKQLITYIAIGMVVVVLYWLFFAGEEQKNTEKATQAEVVKDLLESQETPEQQRLRLANAQEDKFRAEQENLIKQYDAAIKLGKELENNYIQRAKANEKLLRYRAAIKDYSSAIDVNPEALNSHYNRGILLQKIGDNTKAVQDFDKAIQIDPEAYYIYNTRALAHVDLGQLQLALNDYNKALELNPSYAEAYFNRGTLFERQKDFQAAHDDYSKAIDLHAEPAPGVDPKEAKAKLAETYYRRAIVYYLTTDYSSALEDINKVIEFDKKSIKAYQLRASIYDKTGNVAAAAADESTAQTLSLENLLPGGQAD